MRQRLLPVTAGDRQGLPERVHTPNRQMGLLDEPDDLQLFCGRISHSPSSPSPVTLFLRTRFSRVRSATTSLSAMASRRRSLTSSEVAPRAVSPARRFLPASRKSLDQR